MINRTDTEKVYWHKEMCDKAFKLEMYGEMSPKLAFDIVHRHYLKAIEIYINSVQKGTIKPSVELVNTLGEMNIETCILDSKKVKR